MQGHWVSESGLEELDWSSNSPDLNLNCTPLGWIEPPTVSQASSPNITGWPHRCSWVWSLKPFTTSSGKPFQKSKSYYWSKGSLMSVSGTLHWTVKSDFYSVVHKNVLFVLEVKNGLGNFHLTLIRDGTNILNILTRDFSQSHELTVGKLNYLRENTLTTARWEIKSIYQAHNLHLI